MKYKILAKDGRAKRADVETVHGTIHTPVFMNVGTVAAIKGAVSTDDLRGIGTQVELSNTYHLHVRTCPVPVHPGDRGLSSFFLTFHPGSFFRSAFSIILSYIILQISNQGRLMSAVGH